MKKRNFLAVLASCAVVAGMMPMTVSAAKYAPVAGDSEKANFDKYLVIDEQANVPNVSFEYTVAAGTAQAFNADKKTIEIYAGPTPENIVFTGKDVNDTDATDKTFEVAFEQDDTDDAVLFADKAATDYVKNLDAGEKYAKKTATLDFSNVKFDEPGIYRYIITETQGTEQGITYDEDSTRVLDVYVEDKDGTLEVSSYVLHANDETITIDGTTYGSDGNIISGATDKDDLGAVGSDYKSQGFTNEYTSHDITLSKTVTGNQGSKDKYFKFVVKISGAVKGTVYTVDLSSADTTVASNSATKAEYIGKTNPKSVTVGDDGTAEATFYLQNGQSIKILGLADGTAYEIEETPEDYVASAEVTGDTTRTSDSSDVAFENNKVYDTEIKADTTVAYTNNRQGTIPTGIILSVAAPVAIGVAVLGGIVFLVIKNKKRDAEEEE